MHAHTHTHTHTHTQAPAQRSILTISTHFNSQPTETDNKQGLETEEEDSSAEQKT